MTTPWKTVTTPWKPIESTESARKISADVCWPDSSVVDSIFCNTALLTENSDTICGYGLRVLIDCCSAPASHLELCFLHLTESVPMPIDLNYFVGAYAKNGQFRFGFYFDDLRYQCRSAYYRFIDIEYPQANFLYSSPAVLAPAGNQLSFEGAADCATPDGGHIVISGSDKAPSLFIKPKDKEGCEVTLDQSSALCILNSIHRAATQ